MEWNGMKTDQKIVSEGQRGRKRERGSEKGRQKKTEQEGREERQEKIRGG